MRGCARVLCEWVHDTRPEKSPKNSENSKFLNYKFPAKNATNHKKKHVFCKNPHFCCKFSKKNSAKSKGFENLTIDMEVNRNLKYCHKRKQIDGCGPLDILSFYYYSPSDTIGRPVILLFGQSICSPVILLFRQ